MYDDISFDIGGKKRDKLLSRIAALEAERDRLRNRIVNLEDAVHRGIDANVDLQNERDRLASRLKVVTTAISNAAEHQNYSAGSPYDTGWKDAVRWIKQYLHNAALKENSDE